MYGYRFSWIIQFSRGEISRGGESKKFPRSTERSRSPLHPTFGVMKFRWNWKKIMKFIFSRFKIWKSSFAPEVIVFVSTRRETSVEVVWKMNCNNENTGESLEKKKKKEMIDRFSRERWISFHGFYLWRSWKKLKISEYEIHVRLNKKPRCCFFFVEILIIFVPSLVPAITFQNSTSPIRNILIWKTFYYFPRGSVQLVAATVLREGINRERAWHAKNGDRGHSLPIDNSTSSL